MSPLCALGSALTDRGAYRVRAPLAGQPESAWQLVGPDGQPLVDANRFLYAVGRRGLRPRTLRTYAYDLLCAWRWMHHTGRDLAALSADSLLDFIAYQQQAPATAPSTINRRLDVLQRLSAFLTGRPLTGVPWLATGLGFTRRGRRPSAVRVRTPQPLIAPLSDQSALDFFQSLHSARDRAITLLMWFAGLRAGEILALTLGDVDFQKMNLKILGKGRKERMLPLAEKVATALLQYLECERPARAGAHFFVVLKGPRRGQPMTYNGLYRLFRHHRATSRIRTANPHRFRHTFGANMTRARVPLALLAQMMGHSSPQTTLRYIQLDDQEIRQQYEQALATLQADRLFLHRSAATDR